MTAARKPAAKKPAEPVQENRQTVAVAELVDHRGAQESEALSFAYSFAMANGDEYQFKPVHDWPMSAEVAMHTGRLGQWLPEALADPKQFDSLLKHTSREIGRIVQFYRTKTGVDAGEGDSSSTS
ncbi:hypothetical protein [Nocardiopsis sp. CA-288880]|uniref:hypothetical protein n=1 Tax=Nocardiopsis sp. CA-288880 TaxID=3239995 RepID=UPI003D990AFA